MTQLDQKISIKGIREGLLITVGDGAYSEVLTELSAELVRKQRFLQGSRMIMQLGRRMLQRNELAEIKELFEQQELTLWTVLSEQSATRAAARDLGLATRLPGSHTDLEGNALPATTKGDDESTSSTSDDASRDGLVLKETLRSGRSVFHEGHVVIIGDVNPGSEVMAGGDVIVWGRLRGLVHAGALGDEAAVICALDLNPTQLRIANQIAVPPDEQRQNPVPEKAFVKSGQIVAEPWQNRH